MTRFVEQPLMAVPILASWLLFGPIPEEPGWRGYALDGLQARRVVSFVVAIVVTAAVVAIWGPRTLTGAKEETQV